MQTKTFIMLVKIGLNEYQKDMFDYRLHTLVK